MGWIFVWKYIFEPFIHILQHFAQVSDHLAKRFQRKRFLEIDQSETRIACGSHVCKWIGMKLAFL
jgi:hypothetical protein